jgi:hypothetical protein
MKFPPRTQLQQRTNKRTISFVQPSKSPLDWNPVAPTLIRRLRHRHFPTRPILSRKNPIRRSIAYNKKLEKANILYNLCKIHREIRFWTFQLWSTKKIFKMNYLNCFDLFQWLFCEFSNKYWRYKSHFFPMNHIINLKSRWWFIPNKIVRKFR